MDTDNKSSAVNPGPSRTRRACHAVAFQRRRGLSTHLSGFERRLRHAVARGTPTRFRAGGSRDNRTIHNLRFNASTFQRFNGFTLIELMVVMGIIAILMVLVAPAFTTIKSGTDVTSAAYTIKGVLDTARTYAKANNTYAWVGFYEEDVSQASTNPATAGIGRIVMSVVASKDGTRVYDPNSLATIDPTKLIQVGKLTKIDNAHLTTFADNPPGTGSTFDTRPDVTYDTARIGNSTPPNPSLTPFQYPVGSPAPPAQYTFVKAVQFSAGGEARIDNTNYTIKTAAEIGLTQTHGNVAPTLTLSNGKYVGNVVAIQFGGVGADVIVYRK